MLGRHLDLVREKVRALLGDPRACHQLGALYATGDQGNWPELKNSGKALRWYERGARMGDPECQYDLGFMYLSGEGAAQDPHAGVRLLEQAASQGFCNAIRLMADLFATGAHGVAADSGQAERWSHLLSAHLARHPEDKRLYER